MRTSRIARDSARLVQALSPRKTRLREVQTRSATISPQNATLLEDTKRIISIENNESASSKSTPQSSPTRKRKRTASVSDPPVVSDVTEEISTRTAISAGDMEVVKGIKPKKTKRQPAKKVVTASGQVKVEPPANWEEVYNLTREMREQWRAPVDTMGCESLAEDHRSPRDKRFQTLVALMLSSQTKDTVTSVAMKNLQENLAGGFTLESILSVDPAMLNGLISKVGFHNNKTKFIKAAAEILRDDFDSDIPDTIEGLVSLPGVGPKMAYLCMSAAWGRDEGIGVDVHVHRITNLWGWHKTKEPEETRAALESWLPQDKWHDINNLLVGFGQTYCPPVGRKCEECKLAERGLCPSAVVGKNFVVQRTTQKVDLKDEHEQITTIRDKKELIPQLDPVKLEDLNDDSSSRMQNTVADIEDLGRSRRRPRRVA